MVIYSVTQLNNQAKYTVETKFNDIWVRGEITSLKTYPSGHTYFSIRDETCELSAVIFNSNLENIRFGSKVVLKGKLSIYSNKGRYQFIAQSIFPEGDGKFYLEYEKLKQQLNSEGLFDTNKKLTIPKTPNKIGIITSEKGAVVWDMINFFKQQKINLNFILNHCSVQGDNASNEIISGIDKLEKLNIDLIIIARGGGSIEDLWCFNNEELIRKISDLNIPLISAVGHETDYTLCDFVADFRAPTPSYAAELIARNYQSAIMEIDDYIESIKNKMDSILKSYNEVLNSISIENSIKIFYQKIIQLLDKTTYFQNQFLQWISFTLESKILSLNFYETHFKLNHPDKILDRGFTIVKNNKNEIIQRVEKLKIKDKINISFLDGTATAEIKNIEKANEKK